MKRGIGIEELKQEKVIMFRVAIFVVRVAVAVVVVVAVVCALGLLLSAMGPGWAGLGWVLVGLVFFVDDAWTKFI